MKIKIKMEAQNILWSLFFGLTFLFGLSAQPILANGPGEGLPEKNDPFWNIMSQLRRPDDPNCVGLTTTYFQNDMGMSATEAATEATNACNGIAQIPTEMTNMENSGESIETNLTEATNWHSVDNLYFQHSTNGVVDGKIEFTQPIDFMSHDFMLFMQTFGERMDSDRAKIALDADIVDGMAGYGAILTMYNVPSFKNPVILVDGEEDDGNVVSGLVYDADAHTITFNAAHFTEFTAVESSSLGTLPKIKRVKARKFTTRTGKQVLKLTIYGKHFKKSSVVKLGSKKAYKVKKRSSRKLVAYFKMGEIRKLGKKKLKVRVRNSSRTKLYKKKLKLKKVKWLESWRKR